MVVIILCHNQIGYNQALYQSIMKASDSKEGITFVWVDNGSTDKDATDHLVQICKDNPVIFRYWRNEENKIYTEAVNEVIDAYKDRDIYLLNNDIEVFDGWLSGREVLKEWGMIGATQVHPLEHSLITFAGGKEDFASHKVMYSWKEKELYGDSIHEEMWLTFGACMINRKAYDIVGGLNLDLRFYCSDSDLSLKMKEKGYKIGVSPKMRVVHWGGMTTKAVPNNPMQMQGMEDQLLFGEIWGINIGNIRFKPYDPKNKVEWFMEFFGKNPETETRNKIVSKRMAEKLDRMYKVKGKKILELGCVWGNVVKELRLLGAEAYGVDILPISKGEYTDVWDIEADGLPDKWGKDYDLIISSALFEHLDNSRAEKCIESMPKWLKEGGKVYHEIDTETGTDKTHINIHCSEYWADVFGEIFTDYEMEKTKTGMLKIKAVK